jgi:hypothetical protein
MQKFRITYNNGFEIVEAKDIFAAFDFAKKQYKHLFKLAIKVERI